MGVLDGGMCVIAGARGVGDRESAMFGMQLRPLRLPLKRSASLYYIMLDLLCDNLVPPNLGISIFSNWFATIACFLKNGLLRPFQNEFSYFKQACSGGMKQC